MTTHAAHAVRPHPTDTVFPAFSASNPPAATSGPVLSTETTWTPHDMPRWAYIRLGAKRARLQALSAKQRNNRQSKAASLTEAELRAVNHSMMRMECKN